MTKEDLEKVVELHRKWLRKENGVRADLSGRDLSGFDLRKADLSMANLSGANLSKANLSRTDLCKADMSGANLTGANLFAARLFEANLTDVNLSEANLFDTNLTGAILLGATINWTSHWLVSELLFRAADNDYRRAAAQFVRDSLDLCWADFLAMDHPEKKWAISVLRTYVKPGENHPDLPEVD